jgi:energy-coupling factor transporter ATP-binding protein EcfA2
MPRPISWSDRVLIVAPSGQGKSTLAAHLMAAGRGARQILVDPKGEWALGLEPATDVRSLERAIKRSPVIHYVPDDPDDRDAAEQAYALLWSLPGPLMHIEDETADTTRTTWAPQGLRRLARRGRAPRKLLICCTQRLAECHPIVRTQATHVLMPAPGPPELDLRALAGHVGILPEELRRELHDLHQEAGDYSWLWWSMSSRELSRMRPVIPPSWPAKRRL